MNERIEALKQSLRDLDASIPVGTEPDDAQRAERARLERELLQAVMQSGPATDAAPHPASAPVAPPVATPAGEDTTPAPKASKALLAGLAVAVVAVAVAGYVWKGQPAALSGTPTAQAPAAGSQEEQIAAMVGKLESRLKTQPDDAQGWSMLGRSYSVLGRYNEAVNAFKKVIELQPKDAQGYADQADALAMANGRQLTGEPEKLIGKALELDPKNLKALALAGTIAFDKGDFAAAVRHWEDAIVAGEADTELVRNLQAGVAEARTRGGMPPAAGGTSAPAATAQAPKAPAATAAAGTAQVSGRVTLAPALQARAAPTDTVFVFAQSVDGPRVPLAVLRKQVKDLPFDFVLDDSMAMNAAMNLSSASQVVVSARVSKSGNAVRQPGDLLGASSAVAVGTKGIAIQIGEEIK